MENFTDDESKSFLNDSETKALWQNTKKISDVNAEDYRAIFVVGGVGATKDKRLTVSMVRCSISLRTSSLLNWSRT